MWNVNKVLQAITQAIGTIWKSFRHFLSNIPGRHEIKGLHKTVTLATARVLQKVLMSNCIPFNMGNNITCGINFSYRIAAVSYTVETWFVSGILLQIPYMQVMMMMIFNKTFWQDLMLLDTVSLLTSLEGPCSL
jgi:hypothetical protein